MDELISNHILQKIKEIKPKIRDKRFELGDRIFCKHWNELLVVGLLLSSEGYGVNVVGLRGISGDIVEITALPEEKEKIPEQIIDKYRKGDSGN